MCPSKQGRQDHKDPRVIPVRKVFLEHQALLGLKVPRVTLALRERRVPLAHKGHRVWLVLKVLKVFKVLPATRR